MVFQWEEMELALASFNDFDILGRILATSPDLEVLRFFTPEQLIAQLKAWILEPYGRNDRTPEDLVTTEDDIHHQGRLRQALLDYKSAAYCIGFYSERNNTCHNTVIDYIERCN
ncbi:MAG: hypothetical protein L6R36_004242 [Xanthoria steineri]|nr:MAG: hypothetical protein L6R36_004242 [Xanthoria steineri]